MRLEQMTKAMVYGTAFILQVVAIFLAGYLAEVSWLLFFVPILLIAVVVAFAFYKAKIQSMRGYLWSSFGSYFVYVAISKRLAEIRSTGAPLPPNDAPQLLIAAILFLAIMTVVPILPVCYCYEKNIRKHDN